eukprot:scaffold18977_cov76-Skeletonema_dohrnii-CCMP3373.AAC.5
MLEAEEKLADKNKAMDDLEEQEEDAESEGKVDGEAGSVKRERDVTDHNGEQEVKRPKLMTPSTPLVRVKEEPTEFDDAHDETISLERSLSTEFTNNG